MQEAAVKPETMVKRRVNDALDHFRSLYGRELDIHEEYERELPHLRFRVSLYARSHIQCGQAKYEGSEGTWRVWLSKDDTRTSGQPWKVSDEQPTFGLYGELEMVGERADEELKDILWGKELVFKSHSHMTIIIKRTACVGMQYEVVWRDGEEKCIHSTLYTGLDALAQIRDGEALNLSLFRIADPYAYEE